MELIIPETTILDAGYYKCQGKNRFGVASSTPAAVVINGMSFLPRILSRKLRRLVLDSVKLI